VWEQRGLWAKVRISSGGVEISIAGGVGAIVRVLSLGRFCIYHFLFFSSIHSLGYKKAYAG